MSNYTLAQLYEIASCIQCDTSIVLTSSNWGRLALEVGRADMIVQRTPTPGNFQSLDIRAKHVLRAINSGTEDETKCDQVNRVFEQRSHFIEARNKFGVPKGTKKDPIEFVDAESQDELPIDLVKEKIRREELRREKL